ncbi:MAG: N-acetylmuramoyl-L-alanine amidase [Micromonosporaceae bacterium]|nr:N-acetylmuramoyl-L-alanine amidase [Micromonosporaceae bacterium]
MVVHHTATANSTDYSLAHAFSLSRSIQNYHMDHNGWIDTGQNFTISRGGHITEGRHRSLETLGGGVSFVHGAHAGSPANGESIGIENEGTYISVAPTDALYNALVDQCAYICQQYSVPASEIFGHRDFMATQCPGDVLYGMLPQLRSDVAAALGEPPPPAEWPTVRRGDSGERVRTVQYLLRQHGHSLAVDGDFGRQTDRAVRDFQRANGLTVDGVVGPQTWGALIVTVRRGDSGEAVKAAQSQLTAHGISTAVDGAFGPATETNVKSFQSSRGLTADGIVGPQTWKALVA